MCNLKPSYKYCISGLHPVIVVSSFKHLLKNDLIQVIPITSNIKKVCKSHVAIEEFGLDKDSKIMCEQVLTVNKVDLTFKIGKVSNVKMVEINTILKQHLQLDNKFKNLQSEDLEEIFLMGDKTMDKKRELNILKSKILPLYLEEKYNECIDQCSKLIKKTNMNEFLWYGNYMKSSSFIRLNDINNGLISAKTSIKYVNEVDILSQDYTFSMLLLARCYTDIDKKKACSIYKTLSNVYRELTNDRLRLTVIFNMAKLKLNFNAMERLIKIVENTNTTNWYFSENKTDFIENMKMELMAVKGL